MPSWPSRSPRYSSCGSCARHLPVLNSNMHPAINFDVSLPQADIGRFAEACMQAFATRWPAHQALYFGHVGDGNLHVSVDGKTVNGECEQVEALLYRIVGEMQGSVSAEHGIGLHKSPIWATAARPQSWRRCGPSSWPSIPWA